MNILKSNKFPNRRECSRFNGQTITIILNHIVGGFLNKEECLDFVNTLWVEVEKGNLTPKEYADAYDHYVQWFVNENKSCFGTKMLLNIDGKQELIDLIEPLKIKELRRNHWLIDLDIYCKKGNIILPSNYEK